MRGIAVAAVVLCGCSSTAFRSNVAENPIPKIVAAAEASGDWNVEARSDTSASFVEPWPVHSAASIGYSRLCADMSFRDGALWVDAYLKTNGLGTLWIPTRWGMDEGFAGSAVHGRMREGVRRLLDWGDVPDAERPPILWTKAAE